MKKKASPWKSIRTGLFALLILVVFAYGFEITDIDLAQLRSEQRQQSLQRVTRALAQPDIFEFKQDEQKAMAPVYVPCPDDGSIPEVPPPDTSGPYVTVTPVCAGPQETVKVEGFNFYANASGPVRFVPGNDPTNVVELGNTVTSTDAGGHFITELALPKRPSEEMQFIRATMRRNVGLPQFTETARITWEKIIETVFLALLATALGTLLAVPISFLAARNLMRTVRSPLASIAMSILGWPVGLIVGYLVVDRIGQVSASLVGNTILNVVNVILIPSILWLLFRWALPQEEITRPSLALRIARRIGLFLVIILGLFWLFQLAQLTARLSLSIRDALGPLGFLATFLFQISDILRVLTPVVGALVTGAIFSSSLGRVGQRFSEKNSARAVKIFNILVSVAAGVAVFGLLGLLIEWLYQIGKPLFTFWIPVLIGGGFGLAIALTTRAKEALPIGLVIYTITRTLLNTLRSVEAVIMAIVFVIAVGIGPFAGVLALGLHTIVSLAKLYSEQVESISAGPLEAVQSTGANRLQTIVYAVIPQIIPPYISYTMYRWDINVRMSTIIGIVGGGGIGFVLIQNINLLNYRAASAQMIAIAIVVSMMDYISSVMREKYV